MKTIYVDVYFFINFTVDLLALYFASGLSKVRTSNIRLVLASVIGGFYAVLLVFLPQNPALFCLTTFASLFLMTATVAKRVSKSRIVKFLAAFLLFEMLIGGMVYYAYLLMDRIFADNIASSSANNKKMLILSIVLLIVMGIIKLLLILFANSNSEKSIKLHIEFFGECAELDALVDSGNLARDPMDMSPIMMIKRSQARRLFPRVFENFDDSFLFPEKIKRRVRIVPIQTGGKTRILNGIRADKVSAVRKNRKEELKVTIAIDEEGGTYGGYYALLPASALELL